MEQPLNITTKRFLLTCGTSRFINTQPCQFQRSTTTTTTTTNETWINYLIGAPTNVTIEDVTFYNGYSHNSNSASGSDMSGNGGAIYMTGGYLTLQNVIFESNYATNRGGAIYINTNVGHSQSSGPPPDAIIKIRSRTTFRNNVAADDAIDGGQDIYIVPAAVTKPPLLFFNITNGIINVECVPSTLLSRPKFCNYNNDASSNRRSIVIENITTDTEQRKYTNCMDMNLIDTRC
jgi:predicted outer membrane repeat protein